MSSVYQINKGVGRTIEFKGFKAQYIGFLAGGLVALLLLFVLLYLFGVNLYICLLVILGLGCGLFFGVMHLSNTYGRYGLLKRNSRRYIPSYLSSRSRKVFVRLNVSLWPRG